MVSAVVLTATGVNADGHREVLGLQVAICESGAAWNEFLADLVARGLGGVRLVTSDAHTGLVEAITANLPGATWQRCRPHYAANLMTVTPHPRGVVTGRRAGSPSWCFGGEVGRVGRRRVRTLCLAFGGSGYEPATYPTNARHLPKGEPGGRG